MNSAIYSGNLMHARWRPVVHRFRYPVYMMLIDLEELPKLARTLSFFSYNRRNLVSFHDRDYQNDREQSTSDSIRALLRAHGHADPARILALTHARVLGFVFNPVSFFFALDESGQIQSVVAEVNNTFGDTHRYVLDSTRRTSGQTLEFECPKLMHVSPFFSLMGRYIFRFPHTPATAADSPLHVEMDYLDEGVHAFTARLTLQRKQLTNTSLTLALLRYPWITAQVLGLIHWEALKLWWKRAPFHSCPTHDPASVLQAHSRAHNTQIQHSAGRGGLAPALAQAHTAFPAELAGGSTRNPVS